MSGCRQRSFVREQSRSIDLTASTKAIGRHQGFTGGQVADCTAGAELLEQLPKCDILHVDKGFDANAIRRQVEERGIMPNLPPKVNRKWKNCFSPFLYRNRNAIERMFCRLKASAVSQRATTGTPKLPLRDLHRCYRHLLVMSLSPSLHYAAR
jgi:transposase